MGASKAQQKAVNKYVKANYDRFDLKLPKGLKEVVETAAKQNGESVNGFINRAIAEQIKRDKYTLDFEKQQQIEIPIRIFNPLVRLKEKLSALESAVVSCYYFHKSLYEYALSIETEDDKDIKESKNRQLYDLITNDFRNGIISNTDAIKANIATLQKKFDKIK